MGQGMPAELASTRLDRLEVVLIDCQATGTSWPTARLIDVAWSVGAAPDSYVIEGSLVALEPDQRVPAKITEITGITAAMLEGAPQPEEVRERLAQVLSVQRPLVAHYARFERPFVEALLGPQEEPLLWLCTHEIARRLLPGLPRKGLRPLAGYFGKVPEEVKRAQDHVRATALVWQELVVLLEQEEQISTYGELVQWLATTKVTRVTQRTLPLAREARLALPEQPGVYRMLSRHGEVLYVGKATSLKQRVNSYFRGRRKIAEKVLELITQVWSLDVTPLPSALDAALLECDEIKRHQPPYNKQLKGGRAVGFAAWDAPWSIMPVADDAHQLGPLLSSVSVERVGYLMRALRGEHVLAPGELFFDLGDDPLLWEGIALFEAQVGRPLAAMSAKDWEALGCALRLNEIERMVAASLAAAAADDGEEAQDGDDALELDDEDEALLDEVLEWTPELVCGALRRVAVQFYQRCFRASLMVRCLDASLTWVPVWAPEQGARTISFERGQPRTDGASRGAPVEGLEALRCFDLEVADRMSVFLRELRRVWQQSDEVSLVLGDGAVVGRDELGVWFTLI